MKNLYKIIKGLAVVLLITLIYTACDDSVLQPQPQSFFTKENTLVDREGFEALLLSARKKLGVIYEGGSQNLHASEYLNTDISQSRFPRDVNLKDYDMDLSPTGANGDRILDFWGWAYEAISFTNIVLSNLDNENVEWRSEEEKNIVRAEALFHRSYWFNRLVHQFGDVPLVLEEVEEAKLDFNSFKREAILTQIRNDMEFAVQWLPEDALSGKENRAAGYHLLTKIYLVLRQFEDAVDAATAVIDDSRYSLMTDRFGNGRFAGDPRFNVYWDLFEKENFSSSSNTESILTVLSRFNVEGSPGKTNMMRIWGPLWWWPPVRDPSGGRGTVDGPEGNPLSDSLGRGIGKMGGSNYFVYSIYEDTDLRADDSNWFSKDEFYYNNPESPHYGEPFDENFVQDSIGTWYPFPYNKVFVPDETEEHRKDGGHSDWYIYRLAETYLLRAEAYYWLGEMGNAADDLNEIRQRAQASLVSPGEVTIDFIFDERARELFMEENRKSELTRVAYIMAQLGRNGYSLETMHQSNWWFDRVTTLNNFIRDEVFNADFYRVSPFHVYWPVPQAAIDANQQGRINQNLGYTGAENNDEPLDLSDL